jgi:ribosomal protein L29
MYINVQNELTAAINELRDELAKERFGRTYSELVEDSELDPKNESLKRQIWTVRSVFPQRISEAEPKNVGNYYN